MISATDLKYFRELAKTLHVSRAAERLGVTQPTLSHCLKRIEIQLGLSLFERTKKGILLTPAGYRLLEKSEDLLLKWNEVVASAKNEYEIAAGPIRLGCHTAVAQYMLPAFLPQFLKDHSQITIQLQHGLSRYVNEALISNRLDVGFVVNPTPHPDLIIKEITKDRVTLWKSGTLKNPDVLICDPSLLQTQEVLKKSSKRGFKFQRTLESSSLEVIAQLVLAGAGYGILPERVIQAFGDKDVSTPKEAPFFHDRICLVFKPQFRKSKRGQVFIEAIADAY